MPLMIERSQYPSCPLCGARFDETTPRNGVIVDGVFRVLCAGCVQRQVEDGHEVEPLPWTSFP